MDDARVRSLEESLWTGEAERFASLVDAASLTVVPAPPFVLGREEALAAVADAPRWRDVTLAHGRIARPQDGLIVFAYKVLARREEGAEYVAWCSSTWRRIAPGDWRLVQHQQTPAADAPARGG